jgi:GNAT superfamily N-acetyltransferase
LQIITASESDAPELADLIAQSFGNLACSRWLVKNRDDWAKIGSQYFERDIRDAISNGAVYTVADLSAALVAFDHAIEPEPTPERESWLAEITGPYFERFVRFESALAAAHPGKPHHYGADIAVRSTGRNKGVASLLLDHYHQVVDDRGQDVYAEASSERLERFFSRRGYTPLGSPMVLDGEKLLQPMWRDARRPD